MKRAMRIFQFVCLTTFIPNDIGIKISTWYHKEQRGPKSAIAFQLSNIWKDRPNYTRLYDDWYDL